MRFGLQVTECVYSCLSASEISENPPMVQDGDKCMYACQETQCLDTATNKCTTIGTSNYYIEDSRKICATLG